MTEFAVALIVYVGSTLGYVGATLYWLRREGSRVLVALAATAAVFALRNKVEGVSPEGALWGASLVNGPIMWSSAGRPHLLMDRLQLEEPRGGADHLEAGKPSALVNRA